MADQDRGTGELEKTESVGDSLLGFQFEERLIEGHVFSR
jgi:hypothetical protein